MCLNVMSLRVSLLCMYYVSLVVVAETSDSELIPGTGVLVLVLACRRDNCVDWRMAKLMREDSVGLTVSALLSRTRRY